MGHGNVSGTPERSFRCLRFGFVLHGKQATGCVDVGS